jgi:hypothetical protein
MKTQIDHLVVVAATLSQGVQWCEDTLGITPGPGGEHEKQGTHNRLFKIATPRYPLAYFEIIAINPHADPALRSKNARWFDMDDPTLQKSVAKQPKLLHFAAGTSDIKAARQAWFDQGIDRGTVIHANRRTSKGLLHWQFTLRPDGQRLFQGCLPSLIQWGKPGEADPQRMHPRNTLPRSKVSLERLSISHPTAAKLKAAYAAVGLTEVSVSQGEANIEAVLHTPKGLVTLSSGGV